MVDFNNINRDIINKIINIHKMLDNIVCIAIIGSAAKNMLEEHSDIDLLILTKINVDLNMVQTLLKDAGINTNIIESDDIFVLTEFKNKISLAYRLENSFIEYINDIISGKNLESYIKPWVIGGAIPEVLMLDMKTAVIYFDKTSRLTQISDKLKAGYLKELKKAIIEFLYPCILQKVQLIESNINRNCYTLAYAGFYELEILYIRFMFAFYNKFNPGIKHIFKHKLLIGYEKVSVIHDWNNDQYVDLSKIESRINIIKKNVEEVYHEFKLSMAI